MTRQIWLIAFAIMLLCRSLGAAEPSSLRLPAGTSVAYRLRQETSLTLTVNGRDQEESVTAAMRLNAVVKEQDGRRQTPIELKAERVEASATRFKKKFTLESDSKQDAPLATSQFAPLVALRRQPIRLLYADGKLSGVEGAAYAAEIEELLKRDFQGSEEYEFASPAAAALAGDAALQTAWRNVLVFELPPDPSVGATWSEAAEIEFAGDVPSETWLGLLRVSVNNTSRIVDANAGQTRIESELKVVAGERQTTKLGPNELSYQVQSGSGKRTTVVDSSGLVRTIDSELDVAFSGNLKFGDKNIPIELSLKVTLRTERITGD